MNSLPTLRRKLLRSFWVVIGMYAGMGLFLVLALFSASATTPKMIHVNYDSIAASMEMREAWTAMDRPSRYPQHTMQSWKGQFEEALHFEEGNITEKGEREIAVGIRALWEHFKNHSGAVDQADFTKMDRLLDELVVVNENGMFRLARSNQDLNHGVLIAVCLYFLITIILSFLLADGLANRIAIPLKSIAEALHRRPEVGRKLKLIEPNTLELLILSNELKRLWDRVIEADQVNIKEVIRQRRSLETVLEAVEDALLVVDAHGKVSQCNDCMRELLELPLEKIEGRPWTDLDTASANYMALRSILRPDMAQGYELSLQFKNVQHQFSARARRIGDSAAMLYLLHDITEKRQREKFRAEFIDLLSHELKTPLQSLGTASEFLAFHVKELPPHFQPMVETLSEDVERIRGVANEFVQVTQSHSKILKLKLDLLAVNQVLPEWIRPFKILARDRQVKLEYVQEGSQVIWAEMDVVKFPWVISNLLSNAVRFSPQGGTVQVLLTDRNGSVEIQVKDEGPGVPEEDRLRIFEPFYQIPTAGGAKGLFGIGLTIAREVVEAHDGRIDYFALQPRGSEFRISIPFPEGKYN